MTNCQLRQEELVEKLSIQRNLHDLELKTLLEANSMDEALFRTANHRRREIYGDDVYIRGRIASVRPALPENVPSADRYPEAMPLFPPQWD